MFVATEPDVFHGLAHIPNAKVAATDNRNRKPQRSCDEAVVYLLPQSICALHHPSLGV